MRVKTRFVALVSLALTLALSGGAVRASSLLETAESSGKFTVWVSAIEAAGLSERLRGEGPYTVFAPTDEAFARLPEGTLEALLRAENRPQLVRLLEYHLAEGRFESERLTGRVTRIMTLEGEEIQIEGRWKALLIDSAAAVETDIESSNGVIHAIDNVNLPYW